MFTRSKNVLNAIKSLSISRTEHECCRDNNEGSKDEIRAGVVGVDR